MGDSLNATLEQHTDLPGHAGLRRASKSVALKLKASQRCLHLLAIGCRAVNVATQKR